MTPGLLLRRSTSGLAALLAVAYLLIAPPSADLAAQEYRVSLFAQHGFLLWDNSWYGGHDLPGYSILFPPVGALLGPRLAGALCAVASAWLFERVALAHFGERARPGALWFAAAAAFVPLVTGRLTFAMGLAFGLAAVLAAQRRRDGLAVAAAACTTLASPVAGLFVAMGAFSVRWRHAGGSEFRFNNRPSMRLDPRQNDSSPR